MNQVATTNTVPFTVATLGIATFAGMDVLMKGLAIDLGTYNAMLWRTLIAFLLSAILFLWKRQAWPATTHLKLHVWRGVVTSVMAYLFFWGLTHVPIAEAIGLSFIAPLIALYLAAALLKESIGRQAVFASMIGLLGTLVIVSGSAAGAYSDKAALGVAAILVSAVLYAYNLILQRQQALIAKPAEIAFFQSATICGAYALLAPFFAVVPSAASLPELTLAAVLGFVSILLLSWAYARAEAKILIPVEYTAFIWAALFGWLVFGEEVTATTLIGTALIVVGCLVAARQKPNQVDHIETTSL
ncbi:MAG: DMT family transporter [Pseudomonadales bacterium]